MCWWHDLSGESVNPLARISESKVGQPSRRCKAISVQLWHICGPSEHRQAKTRQEDYIISASLAD